MSVVDHQTIKRSTECSALIKLRKTLAILALIATPVLMPLSTSHAQMGGGGMGMGVGQTSGNMGGRHGRNDVVERH